MSKQISLEVRQRIKDMATAGKKCWETVRETGVCDQTIRRIIKGDPPRTQERKANYVPEELLQEWDEVTRRLRGGEHVHC